jgi:cell division protein FtsZ
MDEVDTIQAYLLSAAGEGTDVILGMGYDSSLGDQIGITLIATGFEYKDPFTKKEEKKVAPKKEEKIVLTLNQQPDAKAVSGKGAKAAATPAPEPKKEKPAATEPVIKEELAPKLVDTEPTPKFTPLVLFTNEDDSKNTVDKKSEEEKIEWVLSQPSKPAEAPANISTHTTAATQQSKNNSPSSAASGGYLARPTNIYAEPKADESIPDHSVKEPILHTVAKTTQEDDPSNDMQLVFKDDIPAAEEPGAHQPHPIVMANDASVEESQSGNEAEEQKRRAAERIQKLRNLSFNINAADPNNEFETVPAYIRRNLELYNTITNVENFYSNYEVKADENNNGQISTINTFLDGKNPD